MKTCAIYVSNSVPNDKAIEHQMAQLKETLALPKMAQAIAQN